MIPTWWNHFLKFLGDLTLLVFLLRLGPLALETRSPSPLGFLREKLCVYPHGFSVFSHQAPQRYRKARVTFILISQTGAPCRSGGINSNRKHPWGQAAVTHLKGDRFVLFTTWPGLAGLSFLCADVWIVFWAPLSLKRQLFRGEGWLLCSHHDRSLSGSKIHPVSARPLKSRRSLMTKTLEATSAPVSAARCLPPAASRMLLVSVPSSV